MHLNEYMWNTTKTIIHHGNKSSVPQNISVLFANADNDIYLKT